MKKAPGCTSIEMDNIVHEFVASDRTHPQSSVIYIMLDEIDRLLGMFLIHLRMLYDIDDESGGVLSQHSERIGIAFGLISKKIGTTLRIVNIVIVIIALSFKIYFFSLIQSFPTLILTSPITFPSSLNLSKKQSLMSFGFRHDF